MNNNNLLTLRLLGLCGVLGGLLTVIGDQFLFYGPIENLSTLTTLAIGPVPIETMAQGADWRLVATANMALFTGWLYVLGTGLVYFALKPAGKKIAVTAVIIFGALMMGFAISHAMYAAIGIGAKNAYLFGGGMVDAAEATRIARDTFNLSAIILNVPGAILTVLMIYAIWAKTTHLPKWFIAVSPVFLMATKDLVVPLLPENTVKVVIMSGYTNGSMCIFFLILTMVMWNGGKEISEASVSRHALN